jgi:cell fate regulator YaaT (PSP1 superfamily)
MLGRYWVRVGALGSVGRFAAADGERFPRATRVVCRTARGLEVGEILSPADVAGDQTLDGALLRRVTAADDLLLARLEKNREAAYEACTARLSEAGSVAILLDVEHLFDGRSLCFYFLGEGGPELSVLTAELAEVYEAKAQIQKFADTLTAGCGPNCGTEEGGGCGSGACSTCAVSAGCTTRRSISATPLAGSP